MMQMPMMPQQMNPGMMMQMPMMPGMQGMHPPQQMMQQPQPMQQQQLMQNHAPVFSGPLHWNEDPRSVPTPLSGGHQPLSNTAAKEPKG